MPNNSLNGLKIDPAPVERRRGIKISKRTKELWAKRDVGLDDPDSHALPPARWGEGDDP